jgi:hypothetical protein
VSGLDSWKEKVDRRTATRLAGDGHVASNVPHEGAGLGHAETSSLISLRCEERLEHSSGDVTRHSRAIVLHSNPDVRAFGA